MAKRDKAFTLEGDKRLMKALRNLGKPSRQRTVLRKSMNKASTPVVKAAKANAPKDSGQLKKSIGKKTVTYKTTGSVIVIVGPRHGFATVIDGRKHDPARIAHLVEHGHAGPRPAPAHPWLRPAYDSNVGKAQRIFKTEAWKNYRKEIERVRRKKK